MSHDEFSDIYEGMDFVLTANVEKPGRDLKILGKESAVVPHFDFRNSFYNEMQDSNFKLVFNRTEVPCHKSVIAAASPVFEAMQPVLLSSTFILERLRLRYLHSMLQHS